MIILSSCHMLPAIRIASPGDILGLIEASLIDDKAEDVTIVDLNGKTTIADYMVVATGHSVRQVGAMAGHLVRKLKTHGIAVVLEGSRDCNWVLLDVSAVVIHLFRPEVRAFYNLEGMWRVIPGEDHAVSYRR